MWINRDYFHSRRGQLIFREHSTIREERKEVALATPERYQIQGNFFNSDAVLMEQSVCDPYTLTWSNSKPTSTRLSSV